MCSKQTIRNVAAIAIVLQSINFIVGEDQEAADQQHARWHVARSG